MKIYGIYFYKGKFMFVLKGWYRGILIYRKLVYFWFLRKNPWKINLYKIYIIYTRIMLTILQENYIRIILIIL